MALIKKICDSEFIKLINGYQKKILLNSTITVPFAIQCIICCYLLRKQRQKLIPLYLPDPLRVVRQIAFIILPGDLFLKFRINVGEDIVIDVYPFRKKYRLNNCEDKQNIKCKNGKKWKSRYLKEKEKGIKVAVLFDVKRDWNCECEGNEGRIRIIMYRRPNRLIGTQQFTDRSALIEVAYPKLITDSDLDNWITIDTYGDSEDLIDSLRYCQNQHRYWCLH